MRPEDTYRSRYYSQFGEDAVLAWIFNGRKDGFYIDVGCHHPFRISNTATLHLDHNWSGINIDVDERAIEAFQLHRPADINICAGIAKEQGSLEVTIFEEGAINTFSEASASHPAWANMARQSKIVDVFPLGTILHKHLKSGQYIDLMNIDAESLDLEVLTSNDWNFCRPEVISIEIDKFDIDTVPSNPIYQFLRGKGYKLVSQVAITSIFRQDSLVGRTG